MTITSLDLNEEYLAGAKRVLGTTSKVETVNQALKSISDRDQRRGLVDALAKETGVDLDAIADAWR